MDNDIRETISKNISYYMERDNLSNRELADKIGVQESTVGKWLLKKTVPRMGVIEQLSELFGVEKSDLIEDKTHTDLSHIKGLKVIKKYVNVPILGYINCGTPTFAEENFEGYFQMDIDLTHPDFCLKATGDSMIEADIEEGDIVFFKKTPQVENGKICAVRIDDTATLKRFTKLDQAIVLTPENKAYQPIIISPDDHRDIEILGEMIGLYKKGSK